MIDRASRGTSIDELRVRTSKDRSLWIVNRDSLADRFVSYSDAATAFPFVQAVAFSVALTEPDIRCSVADIWISITLGNLMFSLLMMIGIVILRRSELSLRQTVEVDPMVSRYLRRLHKARFVFIGLTFVYLFFSAYLATLDPACLNAVNA
jgi:hypothetical protein